ncbi:MAG: dihydroorotase [Parasphingorhabdus sp.]|jgi:dihydroorotase
MKIAVINGRVVDPANETDQLQNLYIADGTICATGTAPDGFQAEHQIDAANCIVMPGIIDLQARLREPGEDHKADMGPELRAAVKGGVTTVCLPPDTYPITDTPAMVQMVQQRAEAIGMARVFPIGALTVGLGGERLTDMGSLNQVGCNGLSNADHVIKNTLIMRRAMQYASTFNLTVLLNAQDAWLVGNGCIHEGEVSTRLGLPSIPEAAEMVGVARDLALVETTGVRAHFCRLSSAKAVAMIAEAKQRGIPVSADVTAHHLHLCDQDVGNFNTQCKVQPPLRSSTDREGLLAALKAGVINAICSDHQPHGRDAKLAPFSEAATGIAGIETLLGLTMKLVHDGELELSSAISALSTNPASILNLQSGRLNVGAPADLCIFNADKQWELETESMASSGNNTPFFGQSLYGEVQFTLARGEVVYKAG